MARADWRLPLRNQEIKPGVFTRLMQSAILELIPGAKVRSTGEFELTVMLPNEQEVQIWLGNLYGNLSEDYEDRLGEVEHFIHGLSVLPMGDDLPPPSIESIVPQIKDGRYVDELTQLESGAEEPQSPLLIESLVADLHVVYACDTEHAIIPLREDDLPVIGVSGADLRSIAVENLRRLLPPIESQQNDFGGMLFCGGAYEASILLLDDVWEQIEPQYVGPLLACVPARDMMLFGDASDEKALDMIRQIADEVEQGGSYLISRTILVRRDGRWEEFERRD
ncbi:MAG: DUF1444 family protein [Planctomycetota bacterium]|nr:DUF1444 family protein [Planctomycetota bacterium]